LTVENLADSLRVRFLYFSFKCNQLIAGSNQISQELSRNITGSIFWLSEAVEVWMKMASFNYFGTDYVTADPYKELNEVLSELALLYCIQRRYLEGLAIFDRTITLQRETLTGYDNIRITTIDVIEAGRSKLVDTLLNAAICGFDSGVNFTITKSIKRANEALVLLKEFLIDNKDSRIPYAEQILKPYVKKKSFRKKQLKS
jgi:hypothetical protein